MAPDRPPRRWPAAGGTRPRQTPPPPPARRPEQIWRRRLLVREPVAAWPSAPVSTGSAGWPCRSGRGQLGSGRPKSWLRDVPPLGSTAPASQTNLGREGTPSAVNSGMDSRPDRVLRGTLTRSPLLFASGLGHGLSSGPARRADACLANGRQDAPPPDRFGRRPE
jgi:hypothetical protein